MNTYISTHHAQGNGYKPSLMRVFLSPDVLTDCYFLRSGAAFERPQGGGGVDHLDKVQQNSTQTDTRFICTPPAIVTLQVTSTSYNNSLCIDPKGLSTSYTRAINASARYREGICAPYSPESASYSCKRSKNEGCYSTISTQFWCFHGDLSEFGCKIPTCLIDK